MNDQELQITRALHPIFQDILRPFAPPLSILQKPRFKSVSCSQCGQSFGHGNAGYSDCRDHQDWPTEEDESEANAWRGCLGERTL